MTRFPWTQPAPVDADLLPAMRLTLIMAGRKARDMRRSKLAAQFEADLRVVTHAMMALHLARKGGDA